MILLSGQKGLPRSREDFRKHCDFLLMPWDLRRAYSPYLAFLIFFPSLQILFSTLISSDLQASDLYVSLNIPSICSLVF